uniref:DNA polymerase epsilon subunit 2 n=1 Tax=Sinocyclocheilus rhinocerous TaxID=307959 RepID=A0A673FE52_9TELE
MDARRVKLKVSAGFKMRGLILRPESSRLLLRVLESVTEADLEEVLERILDAVEKQPLGSSMVELSVVEAAVQDCSQASFALAQRFSLGSTERKKFVPRSMTNHPVPKLCGQSRDKAELFRERYTILQQRTHRHELFTPPVIGSAPDEGRNKFQLKTVEALLGSTAKVGEVIVLGMITQLKEGKFYLEDPSGAVQLNMSKFHSGLYTESCFVLAEGWYEDSVFHVNAFGFPPTEPSSFTRAYYGNINFFGGPSSTTVKASAKLKQLEEENEDAMFVIVSDVWLDRVEVLEKIQTMFSGYSAMPPTCFIFCGNFSSAPYGRHQLRLLINIYTLNDTALRIIYNHISLFLLQQIARALNEWNIMFFLFLLHSLKCRFLFILLQYFHKVMFDLIVLIEFDVKSVAILRFQGSFPRSGFSFKVYYPSNRKSRLLRL